MATRRTFNSRNSGLTPESAKKREGLLQTISNQNPEVGDKVMDILGYTNSPNKSNAQFNPARIQPMNRTIDGSRLGTESPLTMPNSVPQTSASGLETFISSGLESYKNERATEIQSLQEEKKNSKGAVASIYEKLMGQSQRSEDIYAQEGVDKARKEVDDLTSQIEAEQLANRRQTEELQRNNSKGLFGGALQDEVTRLNRDSLQKQADLAIIQNAATRRYDTASAIADRKIQMEFEPLKVQLDAVKFFYAENKDDLSKKEQEQYQEYITAEDRAYKEKYDAATMLKETKLELMKLAASRNAPLSVQRAIQAAQTPEEASVAAAPYLAEVSETGAPTIKTINGVDMQWDAASGTWITPSTGMTGGDPAAQKALDNITFLKDAASKAKELSGASGTSGVVKAFGDKFIGDSKFRQLEAYTNTLRTNVLTLMTDPGVKKFFGPQMSEADVRLMTAAGTTLNPDSQSPTQMKAEIERLENLFGRMETALTGSSTTDITTLAKQKGFDIEAARKEGYTDEQIQAYLNQ